MNPVYVKKADSRQRLTWIDKYIATEPPGGARDVVFGMARDDRSRSVFDAIVRSAPEREKAAA